MDGHKSPESPVVVSATIGTDPDISAAERRAYLETHAREMIAERRRVADLLLERLLIDGVEHRIQVEDIEMLCATQKTPRERLPMLMRKIIVEFLIVLQKERLETESAGVQRMLSLPG